MLPFKGYNHDMQGQIQNTTQSCLECGKQCEGKRGLGNHIAKSHPELGSTCAYVLKHTFNNVSPLCLCGCGMEAMWNGVAGAFNDYITGHNSRTREKGRKFNITPEQCKKRSETVKRIYAERGDEIRKKISESVKKAFQDEEKKQRLVASHLKSWQDPERIKRHCESQKVAWSGEAGKARRKKVFTPELSRKISEANMRRGSTITSKFEAGAFAQLQKAFPNIVRGKWFNVQDRKMCVDAWLPDENVMIELDGTYWHGLDRYDSFTLSQLESMTNDIRKDNDVLNKRMTLFRIKEGIPLTNVCSVQDLYDVAYRVISDGQVKKGKLISFEDKQVIVSRSTLIRADNVWKEKRLLPVMCALLRTLVKRDGWFYPPQQGTPEETLGDLRSDSSGQKATLWLKSLARSYWDVDGGPATLFNEPDNLESVLRYRMGLNNSKLRSYELNDGTTAETRETFDITLAEVRRGFIVQRKALSWFRPKDAFNIYKRFIREGTDSPVVWDPSIGFSARLSGFAAAFPSGTYIGTDPGMPMVSDAVLVATELKVNANLHAMGSESFDSIPESLDLVFTSPPFFDKEKYIDEPGQCWRDHPTLDSWKHEYLSPTLQNAFLGLKPGCRCVFDIDDELKDIVVEQGLKVGFCLEAIETRDIRMDHFQRSQTGSKPSQGHLVIFLKPNVATHS